MTLSTPTPYTAHLPKVGDGVRYHGSIVQMHAHFRVLAVDPITGRLTLGRGERVLIKKVRPGSVTRTNVCIVCDAAEEWWRAIVFEDQQKWPYGRDCLSCAGRA